MIFMEMIPMEIAIDVLNNFSFHYIFLMVDQNVNVGTLYVVISVYIYCLFINFSEKIFARPPLSSSADTWGLRLGPPRIEVL